MHLKRFASSFLVVLLLLCCFALSVAAAEPEFKFELTVDGSDIKEAEPGDVITVVLRLKRTDEDAPYQMYAMQDEIRYDSNFFELVPDSALLTAGIASTDIAMIDNYREFYMAYLSMAGGDEWKSNMLIGSFQLKVIAESGVSKLTNEDCLVSYSDGSDSYLCEIQDVTVVVSRECIVRFESNGGTLIPDLEVEYGSKIECPVQPEREGYVFAGWYRDVLLQNLWDFDEDTVDSNMTLYAKWGEAGMLEEDPTQLPDNAENKDNDGDGGCCKWCWLWLLLLLLLCYCLYRYYKYRKKKQEDTSDTK